MNNCKENGNELQMLSFPRVSGCRIFNIDCGRCIPVIVQPGLRVLENRLMLNPIIYVSSLTLSLKSFKFRNSYRFACSGHFLLLFPLQMCYFRQKILGNVIEKKYVSNVRGKHRGLVIRENHWSYSQVTGYAGSGHRINQTEYLGTDERLLASGKDCAKFPQE